MKKYLDMIFVLSIFMAAAMLAGPWPVPAYAAGASVSSKDTATRKYQHPFVNRTATVVKKYSQVYEVPDYSRKTVYKKGFTNNTSGNGKKARLVRQVSYSKNGPWFDNWSSTKEGPELINDDVEFERFYLKDAKKPITVHMRWKE